MKRNRLKRWVSLVLCGVLLGSTLSGNLVSAAPEQANLALGMPAYGSAAPISYWGPDKLTDGVINRADAKPQHSRWSTETGAPAWVTVDLLSEKTFSTIKLFWQKEGQLPQTYHIEVAGKDGKFKTVWSGTQVPALDEVIQLEGPVTGRYVKLVVEELQRGAWPSVSLFEIEIYGNASQVKPNENASTTNKLLRRPVKASDYDASSPNGADKAVDGTTKTRWTTGISNKSHWLEVDLGGVTTLQSFALKWTRVDDRQFDYHIEISQDGKKWTTCYTFPPDAESQVEEKILLEAPVTARYVKLVIDKITGVSAVVLKEFEAYQDTAFLGGVDYVKKYYERLEKTVITPDMTVFPLPQLDPEDEGKVELSWVGADYEQVVDSERNINKPLVDTEVAVSLHVKNLATGTETCTKEATVTIPGKFSKEDSKNEKPAVIPELQQWFGTTGEFEIQNSTAIVISGSLSADYEKMAQLFAEDYRDITGKEIAVRRGDDPAKGDFYFVFADDMPDHETYDLEIGENYVKIMAGHPTAAYWATRTILQILKQTEGVIPCGQVRDYPKFKVRGFMLDVGRHYSELKFLYDILDTMSWYKMNDFQIHLNDTPTDTSFGGFALESTTVPGLHNDRGRYYTKEEFRQLQLDAKVQGVTVVPEIDSPAHSTAFTKVWPDLQRHASDDITEKKYLDVTNPETLKRVQALFAEYMDGNHPTFVEGGVVHVGTDEYKNAPHMNEAFRAYQDAMMRYVSGHKNNYTVRAWGSQSAHRGHTPIMTEGVQLNIWYNGYAQPGDMHKLGYDLINTNDGWLYICPGAGYYNNYLNTKKIYNNWVPNNISGYYLPAGDPQMIGSCFAVWNDCTGLAREMGPEWAEIANRFSSQQDNGTSDVEMFDRIFAALPTLAAKNWGDGKDLKDAEFFKLSTKIGYAPNTNPTYDVKTVEDMILSYQFDEKNSMMDSTENHYDITNQHNVSFQNGALVLGGGSSYVETPVADLGIGHTITIRVKRSENSTNEEQILLESEQAVVQAVQKDTGKVGFSRDYRTYTFDYTLPKGEWVELTFVTEMTKTTLYVNGEKVQTLSGKLVKGENNKKYWDGKWASLVTPLAHIGSETNAFNGSVDCVNVYDFAVKSAEELKTLGQRINKVETLPDIHVPNGTEQDALNLPSDVTVTLANGEQVKVSVSWTCEDYKSTEGVYTFTGVLQLPEGVTNPRNLNATVRVAVAAAEKADKSQLEQLVAQAEKLDLNGYTAESVKRIFKALEAAKAVLADETLRKEDQAVVDEAVEQLKAAIRDLTVEKAPEVKPEPPKTGDETNMVIWAAVSLTALAGAACAGAALCVSRKRWHN